MKKIYLLLIPIVLASMAFKCGGGSRPGPPPPPFPTPTPIVTPTPEQTPAPAPTATPTPIVLGPCVIQDADGSRPQEGNQITEWRTDIDATIAGDCELKTSIVVGTGRTLMLGNTNIRPSTNAVPVLVQDGGTVKGTGWNSSIIYESTAEGQFQVIAAYRGALRNGDADERITIRDLQIKGANRGFNSAPQTIALSNCSHCSVDHVWLNATRTIGIQLGGASFFGNVAADSSITNCLLTDVGSQAIAVVNGRNITVAGNRIVGLGQPGGPGAAGIDLEPNGDDVLVNVTVRDNFIDGLDSFSKGNGIIVQSGGARLIEKILVENNTVDRAVNGLYVFGPTTRDVTLRNNRVSRSGQCGIRIEAADIVAVDNQFTDVGGGGTVGGFLVLTGNSKFENNTFIGTGTWPADNRLVVVGDFHPGANPGWSVVKESQ